MKLFTIPRLNSNGRKKLSLASKETLYISLHNLTWQPPHFCPIRIPLLNNLIVRYDISRFLHCFRRPRMTRLTTPTPWLPLFTIFIYALLTYSHISFTSLKSIFSPCTFPVHRLRPHPYQGSKIASQTNASFPCRSSAPRPS